MRILITGISGFIGSHLADYLSQTLQQAEICGLVRPRSSLDNLVKIADHLRLLEGDIRDPGSLLNVLATSRPDRIFHLAGQAAVDSSYNLAAETINTNVLGTVYLLEALKELQLKPVVVLVSSAEAYGLAYSDELPIKETASLRPLSPFGVSQAARDLLGFQYYKSYGLKIIRARVFHVLGPRQPAYYFLSSLARQIAEIEKKKRNPVLRLGNLENKKDYTDVRDLVRALWLISEKSEPGEAYNLGSGQAWSGNEMLKLVLGMTRAKMVLETEETKTVFPEPPILLADISRLTRLTGWKPQISLKQSLLDLLNYWREKV
ncbi:MAG: GDP-mannose 4,6-dehydratase [Candidatus Saccharicenans sp.]